MSEYPDLAAVQVSNEGIHGNPLPHIRSFICYSYSRKFVLFYKCPQYNPVECRSNNIPTSGTHHQEFVVLKVAYNLLQKLWIW